MPQAVKLTQENVMLISHKIETPISDVQAMLEHNQSSGYHSYVVFDYTVPGGYAPWLDMRDTHFHKTFSFPFGESPNKFEHIVTI